MKDDEKKDDEGLNRARLIRALLNADDGIAALDVKEISVLLFAIETAMDAARSQALAAIAMKDTNAGLKIAVDGIRMMRVHEKLSNMLKATDCKPESGEQAMGRIPDGPFKDFLNKDRAKPEPERNPEEKGFAEAQPKKN